MAIAQAAAKIFSLEQCALAHSVVHRIHPGAKLCTTIVYLVTVISFSNHNSVSALVPFTLYPVVLLSLSGTPSKLLFSRLLVALPFALVGAAANLFILREPVIIQGLSIPLGVISFAIIMLKTLYTVSAVLLLIATTPFPELCAEFYRFYVPKIFCLQLALTYRYISVLITEAQAMFIAYTLKRRTKSIQMKDMGVFLGQLLLRSFDRAGRVYDAMKCRGFVGIYHSANMQRFRLSDWLFVAIVCSVIICLRFFNAAVFVGIFFERFIHQVF